jgi:hypothetical protein
MISRGRHLNLKGILAILQDYRTGIRIRYAEKDE